MSNTNTFMETTTLASDFSFIVVFWTIPLKTLQYLSPLTPAWAGFSDPVSEQKLLRKDEEPSWKDSKFMHDSREERCCVSALLIHKTWHMVQSAGGCPWSGENRTECCPPCKKSICTESAGILYSFCPRCSDSLHHWHTGSLTATKLIIQLPACRRQTC